MRLPDPDIVFDIDLRNPGQFFACCGALELTGRLWPGSEGWFAASGPRATFQISTGSGHNDPLAEIVRVLCESEPLAELDHDHDRYKPDRQPLMLRPVGLRLDWWLDSYSDDAEKSELKIWAGQQTPVGKLNDLRACWRNINTRAAGAPPRGLFRGRWPMTGRFGFDPSASWEALDVGFSPDEQDMPVQTSPATEILAAIGLQRCRPARSRDRGRWFAYRTWQTPLEIAVAPAAAAGAVTLGPAFEFPVRMRNAQYGSFGWAKPLEESR